MNQEEEHMSIIQESFLANAKFDRENVNGSHIDEFLRYYDLKKPECFDFSEYCIKLTKESLQKVSLKVPYEFDLYCYIRKDDRIETKIRKMRISGTTLYGEFIYKEISDSYVFYYDKLNKFVSNKGYFDYDNTINVYNHFLNLEQQRMEKAKEEFRNACCRIDFIKNKIKQLGD